MKKTIIVLLAVLKGILMAQEVQILFRLKIEESSPRGVPVFCAVSVFENFRCFPWLTLGKFHLGAASGRMDLASGFDDQVSWQEMDAAEAIRPGQWTPWVRIDDIISVAEGESPSRPPVNKTFCIAFFSPALSFTPGAPPRPNPIRRGAKHDGGNLQAFKAIFQFSADPDSDEDSKTLSLTSDISCAVFDLRGVLDEKLALRPISQWEALQSIGETLRQENEEFRRELSGSVPELQKLTSSTWIHHGYQFNFYDSTAEALHRETMRLLGFNFVNYYITPPRLKAAGNDVFSMQFLELPTGPEWLLHSPFAAVDREAAGKRIGDIVQRWMQEYHIDKERPILCRVGDEIKLLQEEGLYKDPACAEAFRTFLRQKGRSVNGDETCIRRSDIRDVHDAELFVESVHFRQQLTLQYWQTYMGLLREVFSDCKSVRFGMESCGISYDAWPDYHRMSEAGLMDFFIHEYTTKIWVPHHYGIAIAARHASAAKFGQEEAGGLFAPSRIGTEIGNDLLGITALGRGFRHAFFYEYYRDTPLQRKLTGSIGRFNRRMAALEPFLLKGVSSMNSSRTAVGISPYSEIWRGDTWADSMAPTLARGVLAERNLLMASLALTQVPFDYLPEHLFGSSLNQYNTLFLTDPNLGREARRVVASFVQGGGTLITIAAAASRDEYNMPLALEKEFGLPECGKIVLERTRHYGEYNQDLFQFPVIGTASIGNLSIACVVSRVQWAVATGNALGAWEDGSCCAVEYRIGQGRWIALGFLPGASLARSASEKFLVSLGTRRGEHQHDQCNFDSGILQLYLNLVPGLADSRRVWAQYPGIEVSIYENDGSGCILLGNYAGEAFSPVRVYLRTSQRYRSAETEDGASLPLRKESYGFSFEVSLPSTAVIFLK